MKDLFIGFLEENDALDKFKQSLVIGDEPEIDEYLKIRDSFDFICCSCIWASSEEGHDYWQELDSKWLELLRQEQNETND